MVRFLTAPTVARVEATPAQIKALQRVLYFEDLDVSTGRRVLVQDNGLLPPGLISHAIWELRRSYPHETFEVLDYTGEPADAVQPLTGRCADRLYQMEAVDALLAWRRAILRAVTRSGKTVMAADVIRALPKHRPALFVVERKEVLHQAVDSLRRNTGERVEVVSAKSNRWRGSSVCVATVQALAALRKRDTEWLREVRLVFVDEVHHAAADSYQQALGAMTGLWRCYGLSGTPWRGDGLDILLEAVVGPIAHTVGYDRLATEIDPSTGLPYVCPPTVVFQAMPRRRYPLDVARDWRAVYNSYVVDGEIRNRACVDFARWLEARGRSCVLTVDTITHGQQLAAALGCPFTYGDQGDRERLDTLARLRDKEVLTVVSTLYLEAVDIPSLDGVANAGAISSPVEWLQMLRNLTGNPGKYVAPVLDFDDSCVFLDYWTRKRKRYAMGEPTFRYHEREDYLGELLPDPDRVWGWLSDPLDRGWTAANSLGFV